MTKILYEQGADDWPPQWFEVEFADALLGEEDATWLGNLRTKPIDEEWLDAANNVIAVGSISLRDDTDPETLSSVMRAREKFFGELLGWEKDQSPFSSVYEHLQTSKNWLMPVATFIGAQRQMSDLGLNAPRILKTNASAVKFGAKSIKSKWDYFQSLGLDPQTVINSSPGSLNYSLENLESKIATIESIGIDYVQVISRKPSTLSQSPASIRRKFDFLSSIFGDDERLIKAINHHPDLFSRSTDSINDVVNALSSLGLDAKKIVGLNPSTLSYSSSRVEERFNYLKKIAKTLKWEVDVTDLVNIFPSVLGLSRKKLHAHARLFARYGRADMTPNNIQRLLISPLSTHIVAIGDGHVSDRSEYREHRIKRVNNGSTAEERKTKAETLINDPEIEKKIGSKAVLAYKNYIAS